MDSSLSSPNDLKITSICIITYICMKVYWYYRNFTSLPLCEYLSIIESFFHIREKIYLPRLYTNTTMKIFKSFLELFRSSLEVWEICDQVFMLDIYLRVNLGFWTISIHNIMWSMHGLYRVVRTACKDKEH